MSASNHRWWRIGTAVFATCAIYINVGYAQSKGIEGVWRIAAPQVLFTPLDGRAIPFTAQGLRAYQLHKQAAEEGDLSFDPTMTGCASPGQPRLMLTSEPFIIFARPSMITILYQWNRLFRQISIGKPLKNPLLAPNYWEFLASQGYAQGTWMGNALLVTTIGLSDEKLLDNLLPSSDQLILRERFRLRDRDTLEDRLTIQDPVNFTRPWDALLSYRRQSDQLFPFPEDVCLDHLEAKQAPWPTISQLPAD